MSASANCFSFVKGFSAGARLPPSALRWREPRHPLRSAEPLNISGCSPPAAWRGADSGRNDEDEDDDSPPLPSRLLGRNWKFSTTTDSLLRLPAPDLSSHVSYFSRPSTKRGFPFVQNWLIVSA